MSVQRTPGSPQRQQTGPRAINRASKDPEALLQIVARLEGVIDELKDGGQDFSAQLVAMARLELMMTVHRISEHEMGALRSLFEDQPQMLS
jgi:hypothetical protein